MKRLLLLIISLTAATAASAQSWGLLTNSPSNAFRHDDIHFVDADTGWAVNVDGYIYKTTDGGDTWTTQLYKPAASFRCVGFANSLKGWAGNLGPGSFSGTSDTTLLFQTNDGGATWAPVTNISGPLGKGLCGISVVNDSVVYAVGRNTEPAFLMKTYDGGSSWTSIDMTSYANDLIDCHFFSRDTGLIVGNTVSPGYPTSKALILYTTDGGQSWSQYIGQSLDELCWKIDFPSRTTGYVSVQNGGSNNVNHVFKTTNGGVSWQELGFSDGTMWLQGIGFINELTGWTGTSESVMTADGGLTWTPAPMVTNFNRFRKINDTTAYACGERIWKFSNIFNGIPHVKADKNYILEQNFPNPFSTKTTIRYRLSEKGHVILKITDMAGRTVSVPVNTVQQAGQHEVSIDLPCHSSTYFHYSLNVNNVQLTRKMIMVKGAK